MKVGGHEMAPTPPHARRAPAEPGHSSITAEGLAVRAPSGAGQGGGPSRHSPSVRISASAFDVCTTPGRTR